MQLRQLFSGEPSTGRAGDLSSSTLSAKTPECLAWSGDFTPPSRFVGAAALSESLFAAKTGTDAILEAFYILNNFDIPKGEIRDVQRDEYGNVLADYTVWTSATDPEQGDTTSGTMMIVRVE
jgi:penicillin V acylase-like amidase (Ntn superfamily)